MAELNVQYPNAMVPAMAAQQIVGNQQRNALLANEDQRRQQEDSDKRNQAAAMDLASYAKVLSRLPEEEQAREYPVAYERFMSLHGNSDLAQKIPRDYDPKTIKSFTMQMDAAAAQAAMKRGPQETFGEPYVDPNTQQKFQRNSLTGKVEPVGGVPQQPSVDMKLVEDDTSPTKYSYVDASGRKIQNAPPPSQGLSVTTPDGTQIIQGGRGKGETPSGLMKKTQTDIEEKLSGLTSTRMQLVQIADSLNRDYTTYSGKLRGLGLEVKDKMGYDLSPDDAEFADKLQRYRSNAGQLQAEILKVVAGTALTPTEERLHKQYIINPGTGILDGDSYTQAKSKLERFRVATDRAVARANYMRKYGFSIQNIPEEWLFRGDHADPNNKQPIDEIMHSRGMAIFRDIKTANPSMSELEAKEQMKKTLAKEFGLVY